MFETTKFRRVGVALAAAGITALGVGGVAIAQNGSQAPKPAAAVKSAAEPKGPDRDNIRSGDQTTPDTVSAKSTAAQTQGSTAPEAPGTETKDAPGQEAPGTETKDAPGQEAPGTETKADSDGPGGHADEPGNPNADHQFQGKE